MSLRADVLLWAQRIAYKRADQLQPHVVLDIKADATMEEIQTAFHAIARASHPDLHRNSLTPDELELVTTAYSRVAAAYQDLRSQRMQTTRMKPLKPGDIPPMAGDARTTGAIKPLPRDGSTESLPAGEVPLRASAEMSSKALVCYRKAELELRRGNLKMALLQLKLAIGADPQSQFLRTALAEVQAEVEKA